MSWTCEGCGDQCSGNRYRRKHGHVFCLECLNTPEDADPGITGEPTEEALAAAEAGEYSR